MFQRSKKAIESTLPNSDITLTNQFKNIQPSETMNKVFLSREN
jgi:hypothetical protein